MGSVDYGRATFSLAMIDFRTYVDTLMSIDKKLEEANFVLNHVLKSDRSEDMKNLLSEYAFVKFAKVQTFLKEVKKNIMKYQKKLQNFLAENPKEHEEFNAQLDILIPLFEEKEKFINEQIKKCFDYLNSLIDTDTASV